MSLSPQSGTFGRLQHRGAPRVRGTLLSSVALCALLLAAAPQARAQTVVVNTTDVTAPEGLVYRYNFDTLTVTNSGNLTGTGNYSSALYVALRNFGDNGDLTVESSGTLDGRMYGLYAILCGQNDAGISCLGDRGGSDFTVTNTGAVTTMGTGLALYHNGYGRAVITNEADVEAAAIGIRARVQGQGATILNTGDITSYWGMWVTLAPDDPTDPASASTVSNTGTIASSKLPGITVALGAGAVTIANSGNISSGGYSGIFAYGYYDGANITVTNTGVISAGTSDYDVGDGIRVRTTGAVTVESSGVISAPGRGISAMSYDTAKTSGGIITITQTAGTITSDTDSAIMGATLDADIAVAIGGLAEGAAGHASVQFGLTYNGLVLDGLDNTLSVTSTGVLRNAGGVDDLAIAGRSGNEAVSNAGTVTGNVDLGTGDNSFANLAGGVFNMGSSIDLGAGNALSNAGTLSPGGTGVVLTSTLTGDLVLDAAGQLAFDLGAADVVGGPLNDLLSVSGDLTLDGSLRVTESPGGSFTVGVYRLIDYAGALTDNGLAILGLLPHGLSGTIQTAIDGQVNLIATAGPPVDIGYWDGPNETPGNVAGGRGGSGVWNAALRNWTTASGDANGVWDAGVGVFAGDSGTVTVEGLQGFAGLQFVTGDYLLVAGSDGALGLGDGAFIFVDQDLDATIAVGLAGDGPLLKQGDGRLILSGDNSHAGGTIIAAGTLAAGSDTALGSGAASIEDGATLQAAADGMTLANAVGIGGSGDVASIDSQGYGFTLRGTLSGAGTLRKLGSGTLLLAATDSAIGGLDLAAGGLTNSGGLAVAGTATMAADTTLSNAEGAGLLVIGGLTGDDGAQLVDNAGLLQAAIALGGGADSYRLKATGSQTGAVDGGAGLDVLDLDAGPGGRLIGEDDYTDFEDLTLNGGEGAAGRFVLAGQSAPEHAATLDLGAEGTARLAAGELNLALTSSSLRSGSLTTAAGSLLSGNGKVTGEVTLRGTVAPGNDGIGSLAIDGGYLQSGRYEVEISDAAGDLPGFALSDRIVTTGPVSFGGTVAVAIADGSSLAAIKQAAAAQGAMRWRILDGDTAIAADQRNAELAAPQGLALALDYANGGEDVDLFMAWAAPPDQPKQAGLLWQLAVQPELALCDVAGMQGEASSCAFLQGDALSVADAGGAGDASGWSGLAGGGGRLSPDLWLGLGGGYSAGDLGNGGYDRLAAYLWGRWTPGGAELKGFAGIGHYAVDGRRRTTSGDTASWDYGAWQPYLAGEARYWTEVTPGLAVTPLAGLTASWLAMPGHDEAGAGIENFHADGQTLWGLTTLLGGEARWQATPDLALEASAGWQHLFGDDSVTLTGHYDGIADTALSGSSEPVGRDALALAAALILPLSDAAVFRLDYGAALGTDEVSQSAAGRVTFTW